MKSKYEVGKYYKYPLDAHDITKYYIVKCTKLNEKDISKFKGTVVKVTSPTSLKLGFNGEFMSHLFREVSYPESKSLQEPKIDVLF
jgi:hypothetical protein